jgi:hypothetical protein
MLSSLMRVCHACGSSEEEDKEENERDLNQVEKLLDILEIQLQPHRKIKDYGDKKELK